MVSNDICPGETYFFRNVRRDFRTYKRHYASECASKYMYGTKRSVFPVTVIDKFSSQRTSNADCDGFVVVNLNKLRKKTIELSIIWDDITFVWRHCDAQMRFPAALYIMHHMMTSANGNISRITGHLWIPRTKASDAELWCFLRLNKRWSKQSWGWLFETPYRPLLRHCNVWRVTFRKWL